MFIKNFNLRHPRRHPELFLPTRPYKGEPPTVAGFLIYPDTPTKMETTSREAFCYRPAAQRDKGKGDNAALKTQQDSHSSPSTTSRQTGRGSSRGDGQQQEQEWEGDHEGESAKKEQDSKEMQSQYQKDFPPPSSCRRRRTPARPQPDNIGINPAFRFDFSTVQRLTYPGWSIMNSRRAVASRKPNMMSE